MPPGANARLTEGNSVVGGGSCPDTNLPSILLSLTSERYSAGEIESRLRHQDPPVIVRLEEDRVLVDLRTVFPSQEKQLLKALETAL